MKRTTEEPCYLTPQAETWVVWRGTQCLHTAPTLEEAAALAPAAAAFRLALPCYPLIMERLHLPATEHEELEGMVQLQWEKTLPFSPEEINGSFLVVGQDEASADVWSVAVPQMAMDEFAAPWRKLNRWPEQAVPFVCSVAATCPAQETVLVLYAEVGHWVMAVVHDRQPAWVHVARAPDATQFAAEIPSLLLTAGMEGVNYTFSRAYVTAETSACADAVVSALEVPIERLPLVTPLAEAPLDLLPPAWRLEARQHRGQESLQQRLVLAGSVYLVLMIAAFVHIFLLRGEAAKLEAQLRAARPDLTAMEARQSRSNALATVIDPHRYTVELLFLLQRCLPGDSVQFTEFEQAAQQWRVVGEAPSPAAATDYLTKLKHDADLSSNQIGADPPRMLPNGRAQFQVLGRP